MIAHLLSFGWPYLVVPAIVVWLALPPVVVWLRFEVALWRRVRRRARVVDARDVRADW